MTTPTAHNITRHQAHAHNHQLHGTTCPLPGTPWPWQPDACPILQRVNRILPPIDAAQDGD